MFPAETTGGMGGFELLVTMDPCGELGHNQKLLGELPKNFMIKLLCFVLILIRNHQIGSFVDFWDVNRRGYWVLIHFDLYTILFKTYLHLEIRLQLPTINHH